MNRTSEIVQLETELENLRASRAAKQRGAIIVRNFFVGTLALAVLAVVYSLATMNVVGIGVSALVASMIAAIVVGYHGDWILVSRGSLFLGSVVDDLDVIETMIRDRERRLTELETLQS